MIDVNEFKVGDKIKCTQVRGNWYKIGDVFTVRSEVFTVPYTHIPSVHVEEDQSNRVWVQVHQFTLVATNTKYSDIGEGDVVEVALVDEDKLRVWAEMGELIGKQGLVVYKGRMIDVDFEGDVWRFDAHELRVVLKKMEFKVGFGETKVLNIPPTITKADMDKLGGLMEKVYSSPPKKATDFLSKALSLLEERGKDYDQPEGERSMGKTVIAFNAITGHNLKESDGWLILQLLKDVRQNQNRDSYHADSAEDCISYAALKAEALAEGK